MSWRELVNWDPESYTQIEHNTQNEGSKPKKSNSAYIANSAYSISNQNPTILEDHLDDLTEEEEAIMESFFSWISTCLPPQEWTIPQDWLESLGDSDELRMAAEEEVRKRNPALRIWKSGKDKLICKVWTGDELPPYRKPPKKSRFRRRNQKRNKTAWSEEHGWCRWDSSQQDYLPDPTLN